MHTIHSRNGLGPLSGRNVLLVDDDVKTRLRVIAMLRGAGALVVGVRTPDAAVHYARAARFDAVIVDLPAEEASGLLHAVRKGPAPLAHTPVFAISAARHDHDHRRLFTGYFLKPVKRDALMKALARAKPVDVSATATIAAAQRSGAPRRLPTT